MNESIQKLMIDIEDQLKFLLCETSSFAVLFFRLWRYVEQRTER